MSLLSLFGRKAQPEDKAPILDGTMAKSQPAGGWFGSRMGINTAKPISRDPLNLLSLNTGIVASCNSRNAQAVANAKLRLYAQKGNGRKLLDGVEAKSLSRFELKRLALRCKQAEPDSETVEVLRHPLLDLMAKPSATYDGHGLMSMTEGYLGLTGNSYWLAGKGVPSSLTVLSAEYVSALVDDGGTIDGYSVKQGRYQRNYPIDEVIAFRNYCPGAATRVGMAPTVGLYGLSPLEQCLPEAELLRDINNYERATFGNNCSIGGFIKYKQGRIEPERARALRKMLHAIHGGPSQAGKWEVLDGDFELVPTQWSPKDLGYEKGKAWLRQVVCSTFGVPEDLISNENSNRATAMASFRSYSILTVIPKLSLLADALSAQLCSRYDDGLFVAFDDVTPLDEGAEQKEEEMLLRMGVISVNEAREKRGLEALDEDMRGNPISVRQTVQETPQQETTRENDGTNEENTP